jgi:hypothetical protein
VYFFWAFSRDIGFPPNKPLDTASSSFLVLATFFFILPQAGKLSLGHFLSFEAKVDKIKEDVKEFKAETRDMLTVYNGLISSIHNANSQTISVYYPDRQEKKKAKEQADESLGKEKEKDKIDAKQFLTEADSDRNYALAILRMQIEKELRRILDKQEKALDLSEEKSEFRSRFLSPQSLLSQLFGKYPEYLGMGGAFNYVLNVCNAAIHGRLVSEIDTQDALSIGIRMLDKLKTIHAQDHE